MNQPEEFSRNITNYVIILKGLHEKYKSFIKWNAESESILDIGIGDGRVTKEAILPFIPENVTEYVGADISETMLEFAKTLVVHNKFETLVLDAASKSLPDGFTNRFDHVFTMNLIHHVQDTRQLFKNIWDMLKPGGQLCFMGFAKLFMDECYQKLDRGKWGKYNHSKSLSPFYNCENPVEEYKLVIQSLGYTDCHMFVEPYKDIYSEEAFDEVYTAVNLRLPHVNKEDKEAYIQDYLEEFKKSKTVKAVVNNGKKYFEVYANIIVGIISKPR